MSRPNFAICTTVINEIKSLSQFVKMFLSKTITRHNLALEC